MIYVYSKYWLIYTFILSSTIYNYNTIDIEMIGLIDRNKIIVNIIVNIIVHINILGFIFFWATNTIKPIILTQALL